MLKEIMQHLGISPERTLMIGDSTHDLQMAKNAQVASIGVTCGVHPANILQQYQPLFCLEQTTGLLEKLVG
jgi:phosphoglycolate phosphatase